MTPRFRLPNELTNQIIEDLHSEHKALLNCALVCHSWVASAQRSLFTKLTIHERNCAAIVDHLASTSTNVFGYVQHLRVFLWGNIRVYINKKDVKLDPLLPLLLSQSSHFTNATKLELDGRVFHEKQWDKMWTDLLAPAFSCLTHLHVHDIVFEALSHLVDLVSSFPLLRDLTAYELDVAEASHEYSNEDQEPYVGSKMPPPSLAKIVYASGQHFCSGGGPFLRWLAAGPQALRTLHLHLDAEAGDVNAGVELINAAGDNLEHLSLEFSDQWHLWEGFDLSPHPNLRSLMFPNVDDLGSDVIEILQSLKSPLEHLAIGNIEQLESDEQNALIEVLMSPSLVSLTRVDFYTWQASPDELENEIQSAHPEFYKRGIAFFSVKP